MRIFNKRAGFDYELKDKFEAGIQLLGYEAKAFREGDVDLMHSFAKVIGKEIFLVNASISTYHNPKADPRRSRKLLMHKDEIVSIESKMKQGKLTLIPVSMYNKGRLVKVELALATSKREFQKKDKQRQKDIERDLERDLRGDKE